MENSNRNQRSGNRRREVKSEFDHKMISLRRVARVMAGGRRFSFSAVVVLGDRNGRVAVGTGKGGDTTKAIDKAMNQGKKQLLKIPRTKSHSLPRPVEAKYGSSRIIMQPAPGRGLVAGSAIRTVLELGGLTDVNAKILSRSKNKLNIARATILALSNL